MRRKDREMSQEFGLEVIDRAAYGVLSVLDTDHTPYTLPLSIVRDGENLYFHSARAGHKVELFTHEPSATIVFVGRVEVPDVYGTETLEALKEGSAPLSGSMLSRIFTTEFESAIVRGRVVRVEDRKECVHALRLICEKYTAEKMDLFDKAVESGMPHTAIYRIRIDTITAKRKLVLPD
ncbi:5-nitroimidazole antibiotic resistance protein [Porphyromonas gulae]|uniref:5-nitroimidazole antibiotic resistance protein n=2 Tax=Porphyromonadaceae TaxID=171551 RepID=A0A099WTQ6_9PORP|nr:pyridoxamine 5'-phosphate oxidase family protein [Porphyromonas gulae]KGL54319.1 5-nitroimidazole antibiotic resistance protein [Porphyromonas sp. COT-052 OH4946]KGL48327.1 5-nitroimidazole antibiotic resistance protein [Porphyromonas gulae]KGN68748.1 5-nitroimidazole antibiotic resistance protein [Porphyromonas gulae]KGN72048.1 5-nitroimidazole antibiotic resistance protein [Porphyromonas gulae]KGN75991.1 5-nitroimidazole antibiotic resistance protein [Porphyromonas gulae]